MWDIMMEGLPASVTSGSCSFDDFVVEKWPSATARLEMQAKKDAGAVLFGPKVDVEVGASDASIIDARKRLLLQMNPERNEALEAHLQEQWAYSLRSLPAEVAALASKMPSEELHEAHYYEYMMKLFGKQSESTNVRRQPPSHENEWNEKV